MHYHAEIWVPEGQNIGEAVAAAMAPFDENVDYETGFWDWYQIGGRYTGRHDAEYDPESDPANIEECKQCGGTGFRSDNLGKDARKANPTYTCNGCGTRDENGVWGHGPHGPGKSVKSPTSWARYDGDVMPVEKLEDGLTCYTLIVGDTVFHQEKWTGEAWEKTGFDGAVLPKLKELGIADGVLVTVDYHS